MILTLGPSFTEELTCYIVKGRSLYTTRFLYTADSSLLTSSETMMLYSSENSNYPVCRDGLSLANALSPGHNES